MQIGFYNLVIPVKYLSEKSSKEDRDIGDSYIKLFKEVMDGKRQGMVFPALRDEMGNRLFDVEYIGPSTVIINNTVNS